MAENVTPWFMGDNCAYFDDSESASLSEARALVAEAELLLTAVRDLVERSRDSQNDRRRFEERCIAYPAIDGESAPPPAVGSDEMDVWQARRLVAIDHVQELERLSFRDRPAGHLDRARCWLDVCETKLAAMRGEPQ
jgi:hypothetical protein